MKKTKFSSPQPAYHNRNFLDSGDGRPVRILAEYLEPLYRLRKEGVHDTIVFFGSARIKEDSNLGQYYKDARLLAKLLTQWSASLSKTRRFVICSGGGGGIMEAANRGAADAGRNSIGFNIGLPNEQRPNPYVTDELLFEFHYFFMRKLWFSHLARAVIVFPGGFGTLDELTEMLTLTQTKKIDRKIIILLYGSEYWKKVLNLDFLIEQGAIDKEDLNLFHYVDDVSATFEYLKENLPLEKETVSPSIAKTKFSL